MQDSGRRFGWLKTAAVGRNPRRTLWRVLVLAGVSYVVFGFVLLPVRIEGISMWPTYRDRHSTWQRSPPLARTPRATTSASPWKPAGMHVSQRLIGCPAKTIELRPAPLCGHPLGHPTPNQSSGNCPPSAVADEFYVVGDNRGMPAALHEQGAMARRLIVGKPLL